MRSGRLWLFIVLHLILGTGGAPCATAQTTEVPAHWYGKWGLTAGYGNRKILEDGTWTDIDQTNGGKLLGYTGGSVDKTYSEYNEKTIIRALGFTIPDTWIDTDSVYTFDGYTFVTDDAASRTQNRSIEWNYPTFAALNDGGDSNIYFYYLAVADESYTEPEDNGDDNGNPTEQQTTSGDNTGDNNEVTYTVQYNLNGNPEKNWYESFTVANNTGSVGDPITLVDSSDSRLAGYEFDYYQDSIDKIKENIRKEGER